jgi:hypothetical protein
MQAKRDSCKHIHKATWYPTGYWVLREAEELVCLVSKPGSNWLSTRNAETTRFRGDWLSAAPLKIKRQGLSTSKRHALGTQWA